MDDGLIQVKGRSLRVNGRTIKLRGFGLGNWLNLEHFMIGLPGTEGQLRAALAAAYGEDGAAAFWEEYRVSYIGEADFAFLKSLGVNTVRVPFNYHMFEDDATPGEYKPDGFRHLDRLLDLCAQYQIYAILDLHAAPGGQNPDWHSDNPYGENLFWAFPELRQRAAALWRHIAAHYQGNPWVAGYDLLNEPVLNGYPPRLLQEFYDDLVPAVRAVDPDHVLFLEGDVYTRDFTMLRPPADPNIAFTFHYYPMFDADRLSAAAAPDEIEAALRAGVTLTDLEERLQRPIWCGETGIPLDRDTDPAGLPKLRNMLRNMLAVCERNDISWTIWCYKDARSMGMVHPRADASWMHLSREASGGWSFWGEFDRVDRAVAERFGAELREGLQQKLRFRHMADRMLVSAERCREAFARWTIEDLLAAPGSFQFERCEVDEGVAEMVKEFTGMG